MIAIEEMTADPIEFAIEAFFSHGFSYGSIIPNEWFRTHFGLRAPESIAEADQMRMLYSQYMGAFRARMLIFHKMALRSKSGIGQEVVRPNEQTRWAMEDARIQVARVMRKTRDRVTHVDGGWLNDADRRENTDAINRLSFLGRSLQASFRLDD